MNKDPSPSSHAIADNAKAVMRDLPLWRMLDDTRKSKNIQASRLGTSSGARWWRLCV